MDISSYFGERGRVVNLESNLTAMLDSLCETGIYVIEQDTKKLLYYNKKFKKLNPKAEIG